MMELKDQYEKMRCNSQAHAFQKINEDLEQTLTCLNQRYNL